MKSEKLPFSLVLAALLCTAAAGCTTTAPTTSTAPPIDVGVVVMDHGRNVMWQGNITADGDATVEGLTPLAALDEAARDGGFTYELNAQHNYVASIMNLSESSQGGNWQGWMFFVNGTMPLDAASDVHLASGSTLVWYYGAFGEMPFS